MGLALNCDSEGDVQPVSSERASSRDLPLTSSLPRADAARQKSEALRSLATQLMDEHADYTTKNEQVGARQQNLYLSETDFEISWKIFG